MKNLFKSVTLALGLMASVGVFAKADEMAAPAGTPAGTTGVCNDGSMNMSATKTGACQGHKGLKVWYSATSAPMPITVAPVTLAPTTTTTSTTTTAKKMTTTSVPAAGGGVGQVWVNTTSKVYHCFGTKYYGKTKVGQYMTEAAAKAAGNHAIKGKACS